MQTVFSDYELGQLWAALGPSGLQKLSPELRKKLRATTANIQAPASSPQLATEDKEPEVG